MRTTRDAPKLMQATAKESRRPAITKQLGDSTTWWYCFGDPSLRNPFFWVHVRALDFWKRPSSKCNSVWEGTWGVAANSGRKVLKNSIFSFRHVHPLGLQITQRRSYSYTLGPKVGIIYILGALGILHQGLCPNASIPPPTCRSPERN